MGDTDAKAKLVSQPTPFLCQRLNRASHFKRGLHGLQGGIWDRNRVIEEHHHPISSIMFKRAAIFDNYLANCRMVITQQRYHVFWIRPFGEAGESAKVTEQRNYPIAFLTRSSMNGACFILAISQI